MDGMTWSGTGRPDRKRYQVTEMCEIIPMFTCVFNPLVFGVDDMPSRKG